MVLSHRNYWAGMWVVVDAYIYNNATEIEYKTVKLETDSTVFPDIDGRYKIIVEYKNDMFPHFIYCTLGGIDFDKVESHSEPGENLDSKAIYKDNIKLSIGVEADTCYLDRERISNYDYDSIHLQNGLGYYIFPTTKSQNLIFGIAWINGYDETNEVQTWFASDLTII